jgi:polysaccharide export outer membrane protein
MAVHSLRLSRRIMAVSRILVFSIGVSSIGPAVISFAQQQPSPAGPDACPGEYVIGPEDVLDIAVWSNTDLTRTVPVRPDGKISLPLLNDVQAAGTTPMQLRKVLTDTLAEYIATPIVSVIVREIHSFKVTVIGQVKKPGRYELKGRSTVLDVLAMAEGLGEFAARDRITVLRQESTAARQIPFPYDKLIAKNGSRNESKNGGQENFCVQPGDVILVP